MRATLAIAAIWLLASPALAVDAATAQAVIARCVSIYKESGHPCACPSDMAKNGSRCGKRSAHDRPGGAAPVCLVAEVTPELAKDFKTNEQTELRGRCGYGGR